MHDDRVSAGSLFHVGTSGWSYPQWRGNFYPPRLPDRERLAFYAGNFGCVEINMTFYRLPDGKIAARWAEAVPEDFIFCCKVWRKITHQGALEDAEGELEIFLAALAPLKAKKGPLLLQLPPRLGRQALPALVRILGLLREKGWQAAVEFRNPSWYAPEVYAALDECGAAVVLHDMPSAPCAETNAGAPFVYIRRHGPAGDYKGGYGPDVLSALADRARGWAGEGRDVYVFFNNTLGTALENTRAFAEMLRAMPEVPVSL